MPAQRLEFLVEEPSMEAFLGIALPRWLPQDCTFEIHTYEGKPDLLPKIESRLRIYRNWPSDIGRVFVTVDRDDDDCRQLKNRLETAVARAGLLTKSRSTGAPWQAVSRIVIEELEAWYFGDWAAVCQAFAKVSPQTANQSRYRDPDAIKGGTWEAFERVLQRRGYYKGGLRKVDAAQKIGPHIAPARNRSASFQQFYAAVMEATAA